MLELLVYRDPDAVIVRDSSGLTLVNLEDRTSRALTDDQYQNLLARGWWEETVPAEAERAAQEIMNQSPQESA
jgi:hypothetical protein